MGIALDGTINRDGWVALFVGGWSSRDELTEEVAKYIPRSRVVTVIVEKLDSYPG